MPSLDQLLALMQAGDLRALDHLLREYGARLHAVARQRCRLPGDADDAVQQALLTASTAMTSFRGEGSPLAWLSTLVARSCYRLNEQLEGRGQLEEELPCGCDDPQVQAERRELAGRLEAALEGLSRTDRLAFALAAEGMNSVEIAAQFGLSHDAVRGRLKRARKVLRERLADTLGRAAGTHLHEEDR